MDLIADDAHVVALAQFGHLLQLVAAPHFAGGVMRAAQQQDLGLRPRQQGLKVRHVAAPVVAGLVQRAGQQLALVGEDHFVEGVVGRSMGHHVVARYGPLADQLRRHVDNGRAVHRRCGVDGGVETLLIPVAQRAEKILVLPAAVAQHAVLQALLQRLENARRGGEIHIGDGERQQIGAAEAIGDIVPLGAPGAVAVDRGGEIKHGWLLQRRGRLRRGYQ